MGPPIRTSHGGVPARDAAVSARMRQLSAGSQPVRVPRLLKGSGNKHGYDRITEDELVDEGYGETYNADVADPGMHTLTTVSSQLTIIQTYQWNTLAFLSVNQERLV